MKKQDRLDRIAFLKHEIDMAWSYNQSMIAINMTSKAIEILEDIHDMEAELKILEEKL